MKIIDIHCHTSLRKLNAPEKIATLDVISKRMEQNEIDLTVLLASYFPKSLPNRVEGAGISNYRLLRWIENHPNKNSFRMFGSLDFEYYFYQGINELDELAKNNHICGIKIYSTYQRVSFNTEKFNQIIKLARKYSLPIALHSALPVSILPKYESPLFSENGSMSEFENVTKKNPDVNFIVCHMGRLYSPKNSYYNELLKVIKRNVNIFTDMSGFDDALISKSNLLFYARHIRKFVDECGSDFLLFGTDFPI